MPSTESQPLALEPAPRLGLFDATCVVVGAIVGVGIFFGPRDVARQVGSARGAMLAWVLGGVIALLGAVTFAELGRLFPRVGGQYEILRDAWGRPASFLFVTCNVTAIQGGAVAIIGLICAENIGLAVHGAPPGSVGTARLAIVLTLALAAVNVLGVRPGAIVQDATVIAKLATLLGVTLLAAAMDPVTGHAAAALATPAAAPGFAALFAGVTITLFSYGGWQQALWIAGNVREARRNVPRAILGGVAIVVAVYLAANWAYIDLLGFQGVRDAKALAAEAVGAAIPSVGARIVAGAVAISAFGVLNAQFLTGPWLTLTMARDGLFFAPFARTDARFGTPVVAIALLAALASAFIAFLGIGGTDLLTTGVVVVDAIFFAMTGFALVALRARTRAGDPARSPAWLVPVALTFGALELLAVAGSLMTQNVRAVALSGLGWIAGAGIVYAAFFRRRAAAPGPDRSDP